MLFQPNQQFTLEEARKLIPGIQAKIEQAEAAAVQERKLICRELKALENTFSKNYAALEETLKKVKTEHSAAAAQLQKAADKLLASNHALQSEINAFARHRSDLEKKLSDGADPRIDEAIRHFQQLLHNARKINEVEVIKNPADRLQNGTYRTVSTNRPAVLAKFKYLQNCIDEIRSMKLEAEFDPAAIQALEAGIPRTDIFVEEK